MQATAASKDFDCTEIFGSDSLETRYQLHRQGDGCSARDAHMRFRRTVYGDSYDVELGPQQTKYEASDPGKDLADAKRHGRTTRRRTPVAHPIAPLPLSRVRSPRLKKWHVDLLTAGLSKASANRTLTALEAALNLAVKSRLVSAAAAQA